MKNSNILDKEIDLIQACINRMAQNSFIIKGWLITLVTVILALLPETIDLRILCAVVFSATLCFWYLDAYYLKMEKLFRWKYEWVIANRANSDLFFFDLNPLKKEMWLPDKNGNAREAPTVVKIMFTKSIVPLYAFVIITCFVFYFCSFIYTMPSTT